MADDDIDDDLDDENEDGEGAEEGEEGEGAPQSRKRLLIIIGLAFFLIVGGAAGAFFTGVLDPLLGGGEEHAEEGEGEKKKTDASEAVFFDLDEMLVNLNTGRRKSTFLKIRVSLELADADDIPKIEAVMPRIIDNFQVYLRELRIEDLKGSAGMYRLREELLTRVNAAVHPAKVNDVLFKEMLVQ